jgi:hypothetical protein
MCHFPIILKRQCQNVPLLLLLLLQYTVMFSLQGLRGYTLWCRDGVFVRYTHHGAFRHGGRFPEKSGTARAPNSQDDPATTAF